MLPGLPVRVHDAYVAGEGILHASVLGLFTVVDMSGTREVDEGELMRFLAEAAWYPTALCPARACAGRQSTIIRPMPRWRRVTSP